MILYTIDCPKCKVLEAKLNQKGISYEICKDKNKMIELGIKSAPVLEINGQLYKFKEAVDFINRSELNK